MKITRIPEQSAEQLIGKSFPLYHNTMSLIGQVRRGGQYLLTPESPPSVRAVSHTRSNIDRCPPPRAAGHTRSPSVRCDPAPSFELFYGVISRQ